MNIARTLILTLALLAGAAAAQTSPVWDSSGNALLKGSYNFRHVVYVITNPKGKIGRERLLYGTISFDGAGSYVLNGTEIDTAANNGTAARLTIHGSYGLAASGLGSMTNPLSSTDNIYGLVSNGIFIGCSTDSDFNDLLIAAPVSAATTATFHGSYWVAAMDVPSSDFTQIRDAWYELNPDGNGNLGNVAVSGYIAGNGPSVITQSLPSVTYSFAGGSGTVAFPALSLTNSNLIQGGKSLYISPDGTFVFGGSPPGFDMFAGVLASASTVASDFSGLYYQAGIDQDATQISSGLSGLDNYYGSLVAQQGVEISHQRINALMYPAAFDYTFDDTYTLNPDGTSSDSFENYWIGAKGKIRVGVGPSPYLGFSVALEAPGFSASGVFINPTGVVNAASSAPFTAGISPGEFVSLYGTNLAPSEAVNHAVPVPTKLNGVQVLVNGIAAPINFVSQGQLSFLIPYATQAIASIQVINNGTSSNTVTSYMSSTSPGAFTFSLGGVSLAAVLHLNGAVVSEDNPAQVGETLQFFAAGLGDVKPPVLDGGVGLADPLSYTTDEIRVYIDGQLAMTTYAGLAPDLPGVYQVNVVVPSGVESGNVFVDISGTDADTSQAYIPIAAGLGTVGTNAIRQSAPRSTRHYPRRSSTSELRESTRIGRGYRPEPIEVVPSSASQCRRRFSSAAAEQDTRCKGLKPNRSA
jgi:uncharacterized protein (TIGR03437 family)